MMATNLLSGDAPEVSHLLRGESEAPGPDRKGRRRFPAALEGPSHLDDLVHLVDEPRVDPGCGRQPVDAVPSPQGLGYEEDPIRRGPTQQPLDLLVVGSEQIAFGPVRVEPAAPYLEAAQRLLQRLGEGAADGHRLTDALHRRAQDAVERRELGEVEAGDLHNDIVEGRFESGRRRHGDVVGDFIQRVSHRELGRYFGDRETSRLGRQCRRT